MIKMLQLSWSECFGGCRKKHHRYANKRLRSAQIGGSSRTVPHDLTAVKYFVLSANSEPLIAMPH